MLTFIYRGPLASCNYACGYCPFAKKHDSRADILRDGRALLRFVGFVESRNAPSAVFFTPWGEALIRRSYQAAIARLSRMRGVQRVAIQTNLSAPLAFLDDCDVARVGLWCTFHPTEVALDRFLERCVELSRRGVPYSVGIVGRPDHVALAAELRRRLPTDVYLWVNADRRAAYDAESLAALLRVDPLFHHNLEPPRSAGAPCAAGHDAVSVDGDGNLRRCHFIPEIIGNLYEADWERALAPRPCSRESCTCHIGYVHRRDLPLRALFGAGLLERRLPVFRADQVSITGAYADGSSNPAIHAAASWQRVIAGGTRNT
jgi:MoaA/NifB/PqqE/SkfB family radical SAM enzyme